MNIVEMKKARGVRVNQTHTPAKNGKPRKGLIRKCMKIACPATWGTAKHSIVGLEINTDTESITIRFLKGSIPYAANIFWALLADRDVRRMIKAYQEKGRKTLYKLSYTEGISGRLDYWLTVAENNGSFAVTRRINICHISMAGKLNEGFGFNGSMYIGDFVELAAYMNLTENMDVRNLRKKAGVKYIIPKFSEELIGFSKHTTILL